MLKVPEMTGSTITSTEELIFRQPYFPGVVVSSHTRERGMRVRSSYTHPRNKKISIDDSPLMLLPRAQVRPNFDAATLRRMFMTVPENGFQDLQLSTISVSDWVQGGSRSGHKSALRTRSRRRSDADSGFSSLKRCVTFENLSESSVGGSVDNLSISSKDDISSSKGDISSSKGSVCENDDVLPRTSQEEDRRFDDLPDHLDSFGDPLAVTAPRKKKPEVKAESHEKHHPSDCDDCPQCQKEEERMKKYFGGVDHFLDWIISKWSKKKELQILTKSNFVIRGLKPHFCNFVHGMNLHERDVTDRSRGCGGAGEGQGEGEYETVGHSTESISLGQWRRGSSASGIEGRPASPSSVGDDDKSGSDSWPRDRFGSKRKGKGAICETDEENTAKEDKENDLQTYVQIPPPLPPSQPQAAWREQSKVKKKSGPSKKGGKTGGVGAAKDTGGGGNGEEGKGKKRSCVKKKEKKAMNRQRESTQDMEPQPEPVISIIEEKKTPEPEKDGEGFLVEVKIPDLPTATKPNKDAEERAARARRNQIEADFLRSDLNDVLNQEMRDHHKEFDFELDSMSEDTLSKLSSSVSGFSDDYLGSSFDSNSVRMSSWLTGRLALSQQSSRFTLPMDMKVLEKMSPEQYLRKYCVISSRRHILYQKIFSKNRDKTGIIPFKDVEKALKDVLVNTIQHEEVEEMCELLELTEETRLDYQLFCGLSAFAERILYPKFVTDDTAELAEFQREKIECADFCALDWKFHGVNVNPPVKKMLKSLG